MTREERTRRLHEDRKAAHAAGRRVGGAAPYGWRSQRGTLVPVPDEQGARWLVLHLAGRGWSLQRIADQLEALDVAPRAGRSWSKATLHAIIQRASAPEAAVS